MKKLTKEEFLNKKLHYIFCYEPGTKKMEFKVKFKFIPKLIDDLTQLYNKKIATHIE